jgi:hypothetical protein
MVYFNFVLYSFHISLYYLLLETNTKHIIFMLRMSSVFSRGWRVTGPSSNLVQNDTCFPLIGYQNSSRPQNGSQPLITIRSTNELISL